MKKYYRFFAALPVFLLLVFFCGCASLRNQENADRLRIGMTKAEVLEVMGEPIQNEIFTRPDVWFYYLRPNWLDGLTTEDECLPLVFREGKLIGWGNDFYARYQLTPPHERKPAVLENTAF